MENKGYINHGEHIGDVRFENNGVPLVMPEAGQEGSIFCPRRGCGYAIWADSVQCPYCHFDIEAYWQKEGLKQELQILQARLKVVTSVCLVCMVLIVMMSYFNYLNFVFLGLFLVFVVCVFLADMLNKQIMEIKKELEKFNYLKY